MKSPRKTKHYQNVHFQVFPFWFTLAFTQNVVPSEQVLPPFGFTDKAPPHLPVSGPFIWSYAPHPIFPPSPYWYPPSLYHLPPPLPQPFPFQPFPHQHQSFPSPVQNENTSPAKTNDKNFDDGSYKHDPSGDEALPYIHDPSGDTAKPYIHDPSGDYISQVNQRKNI